jgi:hypothetical protein
MNDRHAGHEAPLIELGAPLSGVGISAEDWVKPAERNAFDALAIGWRHSFPQCFDSFFVR